MGKPRVAAIGLDAAEWTFIEQLLEAGELPNLARIRQQGAGCRLRNVVAYRSELPWTQFVTGQEAATNHYWSTVKFDPATYDTYAVHGHNARPFYALPDTRVISFDVPHTILSPDVDGVQITAWGAHSAHYPRASRPAGLLRDIDRRFGAHPAFDNDYDGSWFQPRFIDALADALLVGARRRIDIAQWLQQEYPDWDLFMTVMSESHSGGHHFWHGADTRHPLASVDTAEHAGRRLHEVYHGLDEAVGRFEAALPTDTTLVVFAVHGMQPNNNDLPSTVLLPELLHRLEFGESLLRAPSAEPWRRSGYEPVVPDVNRKWISHMKDRFADGTVERLKRDLRLALPHPMLDAKRRLQRRLRGAPPPRPPWELRAIPPETEMTVEEIRQARISLDWQVPCWYREYWPRMRAFVVPTFSDAHVRINLQGRERDGIVPQEDYEQVCKELEATIRSCINPRTGNPVVEEVVWMRKDDPMDPEGPDSDLVIVWTEAMDAFEHPEAGVIGPFPFLRTGEHSSNGFAFFKGPGIEPRDLGEHSAFDLTPTIVALLGHEPSADLAGTPMLSAAVRQG